MERIASPIFGHGLSPSSTAACRFHPDALDYIITLLCPGNLFSPAVNSPLTLIGQCKLILNCKSRGRGRFSITTQWAPRTGGRIVIGCWVAPKDGCQSEPITIWWPNYYWSIEKPDDQKTKGLPNLQELAQTDSTHLSPEQPELYTSLWKIKKKTDTFFYQRSLKLAPIYI